jgi:hypothetical protein
VHKHYGRVDGLINNAGRSYAASGGPASNYAEGDKPEFVAGLVLQAIKEGQAQYFANDRLRKMAGAAA